MWVFADALVTETSRDQSARGVRFVVTDANDLHGSGTHGDNTTAVAYPSVRGDGNRKRSDMDTLSIALITVVLVVLACLLVAAAARRNEFRKAVGVLSGETRARDRGPAAQLPHKTSVPDRPGATSRPSTATAWTPPNTGSLGATRRAFLNRSITGFLAVGLSGFATAAVAFLWPRLGGGFGSVITLGNVGDVLANIRANNGFLYRPEGKLWLTEYPSGALDRARDAYSPGELAGMEAGVVALYQKCPHLGCRVPECVTSQWFECPCHGSQYNQVGEQKRGPAPRGLDRFPMQNSAGVLAVDTGTVIPGPPIGTNTTGQEAEGPFCVTDGSH